MSAATKAMPVAASGAEADPAQTVVQLINKLDHLVHGLDALLLMSVSEHLDPHAQTALSFLHEGMDRLWAETADLAHELLLALRPQQEGRAGV
jgi:hypothetical protein